MGALYMVLTLAVMVPMAFLTEAVISHLSSELQTSDVEIQNGVIGRAWSDPSGVFHKALLSNELKNCSAITDASSKANEFEVREVLEGEQAQVASQPLPARRFYVMKRKDPELKPAAYVIKVEGASGNQDEMLPWPQASGRCPVPVGETAPASYRAPQQPTAISFCAVANADDVLVTSVNQRRNSLWKWRWSQSQVGPADRPCICLPKEPCFESPT